MKPTEQPAELNTHNVHAGARGARKRFYLVLRIIDNRLQALAPVTLDDPDSELDWTDLGGETKLWTDREDAFQAGRANGGLLVSADGMPGPHRVTAFHAALREARLEESGDAVQPSAPAAPLFPGAPDRSKPVQREGELPQNNAEPPKGKGKPSDERCPF